jgi:hypothetical protein
MVEAFLPLCTVVLSSSPLHPRALVISEGHIVITLNIHGNRMSISLERNVVK